VLKVLSLSPDQARRVAAVQCNAYGKFQCESGGDDAVTCCAASLAGRTVPYRAVPDSV